MDYQGPEVYPPQHWIDQCKALVRHSEVWALLAEWSWLESWDSGLSPMQSVHCALLDVLAPEVGAAWSPMNRPHYIPQIVPAPQGWIQQGSPDPGDEFWYETTEGSMVQVFPGEYSGWVRYHTEDDTYHSFPTLQAAFIG